jgi:hypothetical protein
MPEIIRGQEHADLQEMEALALNPCDKSGWNECRILLEKAKDCFLVKHLYFNILWIYRGLNV